MRRLTDEGGATAVLFAVLLLAITGMVALAVDVGLMQWEVRQLQNGADAGALAVGQTCADWEPDCEQTAAEATAAQFADDNANDGAAAAKVEFDSHGPNTVTVTVSTLDSDGSARLAYLFAPLLGLNEGAFERSATVLWGPLALDKSLPLTISECEWTLATGAEPFADPPVPPTLPSAETTILIKSNPDVNECALPNSPGLYQPGGFGWLDPTADGCEAFVTLFDVPGNTGSGPPSPVCNANQYDYPSLLGSTVLIPIHRNATGTGANLEFDMISYGAFEISAYKLSGGIEGGDASCPGTGGNQRCLVGKFVEEVKIDGPVDVDLPDTGVRAVQLIG